MITRVFALTFIVLVSAISLAQTPIDGVWDFSMNSAMGAVTAKVTMKTDGNSLSGEFDMGGGRKWLIEEGSVDGNNILFKLNRDGASMTYVMSAAMSGDEFAGVATAMGTNRDWTMTRSQ